MASELLRITDPHLVQYSSQQLTWVDANNGQAAPLPLLRTLHAALGTPAMGALHQLLECRSSSAAAAAVQLCRAELSSGETPALIVCRLPCPPSRHLLLGQANIINRSFLNQRSCSMILPCMQLYKAPAPEAPAVEAGAVWQLQSSASRLAMPAAGAAAAL